MTRFEIALNKPVKEGQEEYHFDLQSEEPNIFKYRHFKSMNMVSHCPVCDTQKGFYG
jgi:hypothetical protein